MSTIDHTFAEPQSQESVAAVLLSGGLDSAILAVDLLRDFAAVQPIYVRFGLRWEDAEQASLHEFLDALTTTHPAIRPLITLEEPIESVYGDHWSNAGQAGVPGSATEDSAVYLPGRNVLLASKAAVWCRIRGVETLAFGTLKGNPFPDSKPAFFEALESVLNQAMTGRLRIIRPFETFSKLEVLQKGFALPLHLTFSCLAPRDGQPCRACNKCDERRRVFETGGLRDGGLERFADPCLG